MKNITYINAGAGSGKTYTLTEKLTEVLKEKKVRPDEIILTTFTVKAANEFKEKSKAKLFDNGLFEEANMLDGALIGTIHSVAYSIISKFWYYLGLPPKPQIMAEEDGDVYRAQSLGTLPTPEEQGKLREFADLFELKSDSRSTSVDYDFWRNDLNNVIAFSTNYEISDYTESVKKSKAFYRQFVNSDVSLPSEEESNRAIDALRDIFNAQRNTQANTARMEKLEEIFQRISRPSFAIYKDLLSLCNAINQTREHPSVMPVIDKLTLMWQSETVCKAIEGYIDILFSLAQRWRDEYAQFKKERNILDFNDLEKYLLMLLSNPLVEKEIGEQYKIVFVDEFQDCSPIQIKIFLRLSELAEKSYWVGDMKQSIFGFRGSDTKLTDAVVKCIEASPQEGCDTRTLEYSWRSVPEIVEFCNKIFIKAFSADLPVEKVSLIPQKTSNPDIIPLKIWNIADDKALAAMIYQLIKEGATPKEIAVLNRMGAPLVKIGDALSNLNIPINLSTEPLMSSRAAMLAKAVLQVADNEGDSLAKGEVAFLLDPHYDTENLISDTLANIDPETNRPNHSFLDQVPVLNRLGKIRNRLNQQSITEFVESVILELNLFEEAKKCARPDEVKRVLKAIIDAAKVYEEASLRLDTIPTVKGFIDYISDESQTLPGDPEGVQLLTMHKSKGLEWKYVIVTSLSSNPANRMKTMKREVFGVHFRRTHQPSVENIFPEVYITACPFVYGVGNTNVPPPLDQIIENTPDFEEICRNKLSEETRLLYVALTRPSHQMILSLQGREPLQWFQDMGIVLTDANLIDDYGFKYEGLHTEIEDNEIPENNYTFEIGDSGIAERRDYSPSLLTGMSDIKASHDFKHRIPLGKLPKDVEMDTVGNCIHHIFRLCKDSYPQEKVVTKLIDSYGLKSTLYDINEIKASWMRLMDYIAENHQSVIRQHHERPFILNKEGKCYTGSIDLCFDTPEGCVLIDFKTCPMGNESILDKENAHYAGHYGAQLGCYKSALEQSGHTVKASYVYYPISGLIVEL